MPSKLREAILAVHDLPVEAVFVPEWDLTVWVRSLNGLERNAFEQAIIVFRQDSAETNYDNVRLKLLCLCLVDEDGSRLFGDNELEALGGKSAAAIERLFDVARRLNGMSTEAVADLTKN